MQRSRKMMLGLEDNISLKEVIHLPTFAEHTWTKCRITYARHIEKITYEPYQLRPVHSLQLVQADDIDYAYKYKDRSALDALFAQGGGFDNILMVKQGFISDSYYANVVFENAKGYFTPDTPLLQGVQRAYLLEQKRIKPCSIRVEDIPNYERVHLINAFMGLGDCVVDTAAINNKHYEHNVHSA